MNANKMMDSSRPNSVRTGHPKAKFSAQGDLFTPEQRAGNVRRRQEMREKGKEQGRVRRDICPRGGATKDCLWIESGQIWPIGKWWLGETHVRMSWFV